MSKLDHYKLYDYILDSQNLLKTQSPLFRIHAIHLRLHGPLAPPKSGTSKSVRLSVMRGGGQMMVAYSGLLGPRGQSTPTTIKVGKSKYLTKIPYKVLI